MAVNPLITTPQTGALNPQVQVGGKNLPIKGFNVFGGCTGAIGHATILTSRQQLIAQKIDLIAMSSASPGYLPVNITMQNPTSSPGLLPAGLFNSAPTPQKQQPVIFNGEYVSTEWDYDSDEVTIHCRDFGGRMTDQRRILASVARGITATLSQGIPLPPGIKVGSKGVPTADQSISKIITAIANQFSLTPAIFLQTNNDPTLGALYGNGNLNPIYDPIPQSMWSVINRLALDLGYITFITPDGKHLYFGVLPTASPITQTSFPTIQLSYNLSPAPAGAIPCKDLKVTHNPRRNETFSVLVISYDPGAGQQTSGTATAIGSNMNIGNQSIQAGIWVGPQAAAINNQFQTVNNMPIPLYTFHIDGLNVAKAQSRAVSIANDIQKRSITFEAKTDGLINIYPGQAISITGNVPSQSTPQNNLVSTITSALTSPPPQANRTIDKELLGATKFHVAEYHHTFSMPTGNKSGGFMTTIKALNISTQGTGNPLKPLKQQNAKR